MSARAMVLAETRLTSCSLETPPNSSATLSLFIAAKTFLSKEINTNRSNIDPAKETGQGRLHISILIIP